jgi:hypothetical protein
MLQIILYINIQTLKSVFCITNCNIAIYSYFHHVTTYPIYTTKISTLKHNAQHKQQAALYTTWCFRVKMCISVHVTGYRAVFIECIVFVVLLVGYLK